MSNRLFGLQDCRGYEDEPIWHGSSQAGKCVETLGNDKFYLPYSIRVYARNEMGEGPVPGPVKGLSAVKGKLASSTYTFEEILECLIIKSVSTVLVALVM